MFSAHRSRSNGQMELRSFSKNEPIDYNKSIENEVSRNNSEEYILQGVGITKTVETSINVERSHEDGRVQTTRSPF